MACGQIFFFSFPSMLGDANWPSIIFVLLNLRRTKEKECLAHKASDVWLLQGQCLDHWRLIYLCVWNEDSKWQSTVCCLLPCKALNGLAPACFKILLPPPSCCPVWSAGPFACCEGRKGPNVTCLCGMFLPSSRALASSGGLLVKWQKRKLLAPALGISSQEYSGLRWMFFGVSVRLNFSKAN